MPNTTAIGISNPVPALGAFLIFLGFFGMLTGWDSNGIAQGLPQQTVVSLGGGYAFKVVDIALIVIGLLLIVYSRYK